MYDKNKRILFLLILIEWPNDNITMDYIKRLPRFFNLF